MKQLETLARAISRRKVKIEFNGDGASTNGKTINLPAFAVDAELDERQLAIIRGYCDHETAHVTETDFTLIPSDIATKAALNILEDVRIERIASEQYHGAWANLQALNAELLRPTKSKAGMLLIEGMRHVAGFKLDLPDYSSHVKAVFGNDIFERMLDMKSTADAMAIALDVVDKLRGEGMENRRRGVFGSIESTPELGQFEGSGQPEQDEPEQVEPDEQAQPEQEEPGQSEYDTEATIDDGQMEDDDTSGAPTEPGQSGDDDDEANPDESLEDLVEFKDKMDGVRNRINEMALESRHGSYSAPDSKYDKITNGKRGSLNEYMRFKEQLGSLNTARAKVVAMFKASTASKWIGNREQGRINNAHVARVATGDRRVFKQKVRRQTINTAISFLIDTSASMNGNKKIEAATMAVILFLETMNGVGVKTEVLGYTTNGVERFNHGTRHEGLRTYVYKEFHEALNRKVKETIGAIRKNTKHNNCDCESLRIAWSRLMARKETRKIMIVLTDGDQNFYCSDCRTAAKELKRTIDEIRRSGVELIAIDLYSGHASYYPEHIVVGYRDNLSEKIMGSMKTILVV